MSKSQIKHTKDTTTFKTRPRIKKRSIRRSKTSTGLRFHHYLDRREPFPDLELESWDPRYEPGYQLLKPRTDLLCIPFEKASKRVPFYEAATGRMAGKRKLGNPLLNFAVKQSIEAKLPK